MLEILLTISLLLLTAPPLGYWLWKILEPPAAPQKIRSKLESWLWRLLGINPDTSMTWKGYAQAILLFNGLGFILVYVLQRAQSWLPLNPAKIPSVHPDLAFNTAASFASNTNWQSYAGETALSYLTQMVGLTSQNFLSAATGIVVLAVLLRGMVSSGHGRLGNAWVDLVRVTLFFLLPLSAVVAIVLSSQGVVQDLSAPVVVATSSGVSQQLPLGAVASQVAIKQLGTNGGGFYGVNSAHPLENPTPLSNLIQCWAILALPVAVLITYAKYVGKIRSGLALLATMSIIFLPCLALTVWSESQAAPALMGLPLETSMGNMEGKESRIGAVASALWATCTTAASNGSVNAMHDSFNPLGGLSAMFLMLTGEVVFGGVGSGLYGLLAFVIISVFVAGQLVGRSPEFLGKKIEAAEIKLCAIITLVPCATVLLFSALACWTGEFQEAVSEPLPHGFSELLYCAASMGNNNGSAFAGFGSDRPFFNLMGGLVMLISRFYILIPVIALAASFANKHPKEATKGTLPTDSFLFVLFTAGVVILIGALSFLPALALGPIAEFLN